MDNILKENNFTFKKQFGQNFISDKNLLKAIVREGGIEPMDEVLEIGPGAGSLTEELLNSAKKVVSYEIDRDLIPILTQKFSSYNNFKLINMDIMKEDIKDIESHFEGEYVLVANLPYYITSPIIFKFLKCATRLKSLYIMVQKEVGERMCASKSSKDYGVFSVIVDSYSYPEITRIVPRKMFYPEPNVDSCMIKLSIDKDKYKINDRAAFENFIKASFAMRRKKLSNNLESILNIKKSKIEEILSSLDFNPSVRAEELETSDFITIFDYMHKNNYFKNL